MGSDLRNCQGKNWNMRVTVGHPQTCAVYPLGKRPEMEIKNESLVGLVQAAVVVVGLGM